jgi:hypothetical protein
MKFSKCPSLGFMALEIAHFFCTFFENNKVDELSWCPSIASK